MFMINAAVDCDITLRYAIWVLYFAVSMSMGERRPCPRKHWARLRGGFPDPYRYHEEVCCNIFVLRRYARQASVQAT